MRPVLPIAFSVCAASTPAALPGSSGQAQTLDADAEEFVRWAAEAAIPIDLEAGIAPEMLAPLVADRRIVFLGEPDHYIQEKYHFRLAFLRALHALGWRHLGMEMGRADGHSFDRYLDRGDEAEFLEISLYGGVPSFASALDRGGFVGAEVAYARAVRALAGGTERIHYFGFDVDVPVARGLSDARARLAGLAGVEELALVLEDAAAAEDPPTELMLLAGELLEESSSLAASLPEDVRAELVLDLEMLAASLRFQKVDLFDETEPARLIAAFARREESMFRSIDATLARLGSEARVVLTGHNMHLSRTVEGARWRELDTELEIELWPTVGQHVTRNEPGDVFAIWLVYDHGVHLAASAGGGENAVASVLGTVENLLARLGHGAFLLPLASEDPRSDWLDEERAFRVNGGVGHGHLRRLADALVFVREAHAPGTPPGGEFAAPR